jgi:hypothetical protein
VEEIVIGVAIIVISAAIIGGAKLLLSERNRETARAAVRQRFCRHEWQPLDERIISISNTEECAKCNARR